MVSEDRLVNSKIIEKLTSDSSSLKSMLDLGDDCIDIQADSECLIVNFVLCDVVIENAFCCGAASNNDSNKDNRITIYFKPLCELGKELSSIKTKSEADSKHPMENSLVESIMKLLNKDKEKKQILLQYNNSIEDTKQLIEQLQREKSILETKANQSENILRKLPKKLMNKKVILENKYALVNLERDISIKNNCINNTSKQISELIMLRNNLEAEINYSMDEMLELLSANYTIDKIEAL